MTNQTYKTGDILISPVKKFPIYDHYGIVFYQDQKAMVASFDKIVKIETLDYYKTDCDVTGHIPSTGNYSDQDILDKVNALNHNHPKFRVLGYNCENFVRDVCGCDFGRQQKHHFWGMVLTGVFILAIVFIIIKD